MCLVGNDQHAWVATRILAQVLFVRHFSLGMAETEEQRLQNDALARTQMAEHMKAVAEAEARGETGDRGAWKWAIRKRIWDHMEAENIAAPPRPVHHRIPNFVGADQQILLRDSVDI